MNCTKKNEVEDKEGTKDDFFFFIADSGGSDEEEEFHSDFRKQQKSRRKQTAHLRKTSPPLILAFPITSEKTPQNTSSVPGDDLQEEEEEDSDQPIEEWMILGGEELEEDSNILLNLGYWSSSDDEFGDEDIPDEKSTLDIWAVSDKDKYGAAQSLAFRYFIPGPSSICYVCNKTGHLAKYCTSQKGHIQRDCPRRPCPHCGLTSHGLDPCRVPPVWKQHCQRCGTMGHLTDACPDTWRQYHLTVDLEVPLKPRTVCSLKQKSHRAHCYNCSDRGHYGYECTRRRMISGTFPSLPYVCHYDTAEDVLLRGTRTHTGAKDLLSTGSCPPPDHLRERAAVCGEKNGRSRKKQEVRGRRKTWPERRRERREVKRLRKEAKVRREGGGSPRCNSDDEVCPVDPFRHKPFTSPPEKKKMRGERWGKEQEEQQSREVKELVSSC
ncbi:zinc finger CCHC domain-containing protein 7 isoform X2 [Austrofundulus limnaeus]|uniref:Zinc finger CCHC domain-containing protein 7 n=1 Tax=Austrofundulus limnaeus TaxID=52670 RepID=A0A2I4B2Y7_AUSLI|nr:PREDICTED: zinc finger CCHC domain-containing protein 7-like isoform X2 [Austrofundulus limnaeus]